MLVPGQYLDWRATRVPTLFAIILASEVYERHGHPLRITCVDRAGDTSGSLHRVGLAVDLGIRDANGEVFPDDVIDSIVDELKHFIGKPNGQWDVVNERDAPGGPHIHCEFDPRG